MLVQSLKIQDCHFPRLFLAQAINERPLPAIGGINVGFVMDEVDLGQVFLRIRPLYPDIIPPMHHVRISFIYNPY
jgi:hypothetical protein